MKKSKPVKKTLIKTAPKVSKPLKTKAPKIPTYKADTILAMMPFHATDYMDQVALLLKECQETCQWEIDDLTHYLAREHNEYFRPLTKKGKLAYRKQLKEWKARHQQVVGLQKLCQQLQDGLSTLDLSRAFQSPLAL